MSMVGMAIVMARRCGRSGAEELEVLLSAGSGNINHVVQVKTDETDGQFCAPDLQVELYRNTPPGFVVPPEQGGMVFKGKKMAGHMGAATRTVKNVWIYKIEPKRDLMWVQGQVPGHKGNFVYIRDAFYKKPDF